MINNLRVQRTFSHVVYLTAAVFALFLFSTATNAQANVVNSNYTETVQPTIYSGCAGQVDLTLQGDIHFVTQTTETPSGQRLIRYHINYQGVSAVDPSGNVYRVSSNSNDTTVWDDPDQRNFTLVQYFKLIGRGRAANERVRSVSHMTMNNNGEITAIFSRFEADCSTSGSN